MGGQGLIGVMERVKGRVEDVVVEEALERAAEADGVGSLKADFDRFKGMAHCAVGSVSVALVRQCLFRGRRPWDRWCLLTEKLRDASEETFVVLNLDERRLFLPGCTHHIRCRQSRQQNEAEELVKVLT